MKERVMTDPKQLVKIELKIAGFAIDSINVPKRVYLVADDIYDEHNLIYTPETFTFESPGIAGNTKHYPGNPIGHSRTYTIPEEPDVRYVLES